MGKLQSCLNKKKTISLAYLQNVCLINTVQSMSKKYLFNKTAKITVCSNKIQYAVSKKCV